jgi:hypothetical protein
MKTFILCLLLAFPALAQSDLPVIGQLSDIRGKTHYYLTAPAQERKLLLKEMDKLKSGLILVGNPDEAEFFIEYSEKPEQSEFGRNGQMDVYIYREKRKVVVWSEGKLSNGTTPPYLVLPRRFVKDYKKMQPS